MKKEYIISIKGKGTDPKKGGRRAVILENRPRAVFGRRLSLSGVGPFFTWIQTATMSYSTPSQTFYYPYLPDERWWLRENDLIVVLVHSDSAYTVSETMTTASTGAYGLHWKRWKEGDATDFDVSFDSPTVSSTASIEVFGLRGAPSSGDPFTSAQSSGSGTSVSFPSVSTSAKDSLVVNAVKLETTGSGTDSFSSVTNSSLDNFSYYRDSLGSKGVFVGNAKAAGPSGATSATTTVSGSSWDAVTFSVKSAPAARALSGPHVSAMPTDPAVSTMPTTPVLLPDDIVLYYTLTDSSATSTPTGWERLDGTPAIQGTKYLHVFWKRWASGDSFYDEYSLRDLRFYSVVRNAAKSGNPFSASAVSTGNGTTATGPTLTASNGQLVVFATLLKRPPNKINPFGAFTVTGASEIEVDYDSGEANYVTPGYFRTVSAYATGTSVGAFSQALNVTATDFFTVAIAVKKA